MSNIGQQIMTKERFEGNEFWTILEEKGGLVTLCFSSWLMDKIVATYLNKTLGRRLSIRTTSYKPVII